ncbi:aromatic ring-hydroxylating dioxygenase subunit alpha [Nocardia jinanensis]|uniref:cholesterol 7-desaturase n=1 Tax=Nocardia jinanensis TaxID=382504 RepID=A0A917RLL3_9NOCA|nr:Rieske 2Fe-2S domain-containing protein [Nocardia jinanensis]GGL12314.1 (2Fe-2S) ferredoxin [Nocardia jinanensis]
MTIAHLMKPTGWFQVGWSADLPVGKVVPMQYFGHELVAFRGKDAVVRILDAHCQHLGANLAYGGCVVDDGIQCPFHGWVWDENGRNVSIPYQDRPNRTRRVRSWPVAEINESIYLWHDVDGSPPVWEVPDVFRDLEAYTAGRDFHRAYPGGRNHFTGVRIPPNVLPENAVDVEHFRFVHRTPTAPVALHEEADEHTWKAKIGFGRRWASGQDTDETTNTLYIVWSGIGISVTAEHMRAGVRVVNICPTPVDDETCEIFGTVWIEKTERDAEPGYLEGRLQETHAALPDDVNIWAHQIYIDPPGLAASEAAGFTRLRKWVRNFYPVGHGAKSMPAISSTS